MTILAASNRALRCLTHPLALAAVALVAANDYFLRPLWPSWWTGKLSDIGLLFFLPLLLAALLTFVLPRREKLAAGLAFGGVLTAFLLLKASPLSSAWLTSLLPIRALPDPSDLLALPALAAAWLFWLHPPKAASTRPQRWRLLVLPLAAIVTLADAAAPSYGVTCFFLQDNTLHSFAAYSSMQSTDGGLTWQTETTPMSLSCGLKNEGDVLNLVSQRGIHYRVSVSGAVERSADGQAWETLYTASQLSQPEMIYLKKTIPANLSFVLPPLDAILDPSSGNLVVAMGLEGALIVPEKGAPTWVAIGQYRHASLQTDGLSGYLNLLGGEIGWVVTAGLIWLATALLRLRTSKWQIILVVLGWILLALSLLAVSPSLINEGEGGIFFVLIFLFALLWELVLMAIGLIRSRKQPLGQILLRAAAAILLAPILFLPYLAWALNLLPEYSTAQLIAALLVVLAGAGALLWKAPTSSQE